MLIVVKEHEREFLLWWAKAHNAPSWFVKKLEKPEPLKVTRWKGKAGG